MFLLSTAYWIASLSTLIQFFQAWFLSADPDTQKTPHYLFFFNALMLVNYILTDGVVVWRAWVLCHADGKRALIMCLFLLCLVAASVAATITIRIVLTVIDTETGIEFDELNLGINVTQFATMVFSILNNSIATSLISIKAWKSRSVICNDLNASVDGCAKAGKIFALLIETGVLYTLSCLASLIFSVIPLKIGTVGDLYTPVNVQLAGIYPLVVLLLVTHNLTLDETVREQTGFCATTMQLESAMHFERRSVISIGSDKSEANHSADVHRCCIHKRSVSFSAKSRRSNIKGSV
ncbi:hypothetical protein GYMLUDRAFT_250113 [Collybiopsis luxurians FD-317 M1]|uniref:Uncharacterized protein n=1 Tax=Collybiopsis luxurians FD-317 M1 TaxID=944289 RepID=A0A0D0BVU4_9AGAR|nr:hypothetical protein GYMLUDRAFT_250113 [Collybiopsis luxurians FD-317 M1]